MRLSKALPAFSITLLLQALSSTSLAASSNAGIGSKLLPKTRVAPLNGRTKLPETKSLSRQPVAEGTAISLRGGASDVPSSKAIQGVIAMAFIEAGVKKALAAANIEFPSLLGGCVVLFFVLVLAQFISPGAGDGVYEFLLPGANLLAKWLPAFFVPGLAMLPLAPSIGSPVEIFKAFSVLAIGFVYSLATISFTVLALRKAQGATNEAPVPPKLPKRRRGKAATAPAMAKAKPFADETVKFLAIATAVFTALCIGASRMEMEAATPLTTISLISTTFFAYTWAVRLPADVNKVVHPLVTASGVTLAVIQLVSLAIGWDLKDFLRTYKVGSMNLMKTGAGDVLLWLLGPAVVSFAVSMYSRKHLLYQNFFTVVTSMIVGSAGGLYGTAAFVRAINLGGSNGKLVRLSILARNVTTALSLAIADMLNGSIALAAVFVVITGVIGGTYGKSLLKALGINDPITRGLGMGGAAQGLGVAAMADEPDAFPFAAISMVLTAVCATTLVSIPVTKEALVKLAGGSATQAM